MAIDPITDNLLGVAINIEAKKEKREQTLEECLDEYADHRYVVSFLIFSFFHKIIAHRNLRLTKVVFEIVTR